MTTVPALNGHCFGPGKPDQHHNLCPVEWTSPFGVTFRCTCDNHPEEKEAD